MKLLEALPEFSAELWASLAEAGHKNLAAQVADVEIERYTYDSSCNAAYIYIRPAQDLGQVEKSINGIKHGESISVKHPYYITLDTDIFGRLTGIALLNGSEVAKKLAAVLPPK